MYGMYCVLDSVTTTVHARRASAFAEKVDCYHSVSLLLTLSCLFFIKIIPPISYSASTQAHPASPSRTLGTIAPTFPVSLSLTLVSTYPLSLMLLSPCYFPHTPFHLLSNNFPIPIFSHTTLVSPYPFSLILL